MIKTRLFREKTVFPFESGRTSSSDYLQRAVMARLPVVVLSLVLLALVAADHHEGEHPHVKTSLGELEGTLLKTHEGKTVEAFLGIPYAQPPIGALRFKAPVPIEKFESTLNVHKLPPSCLQASVLGPERRGLGDYIFSRSEESEDCLYLNIYVPHPRPTNASVLVFVHGGYYMAGSSNMDKYDGRELAADENVIVVTINYRLSIFGLLYMGCEEAPGNQGLLDMRLALKFVREHITDFGGQQKGVTLAGEGSGANAAGLLMLSHSCDCLFQKLILLNGSPLNVFAVQSKKEASGIANRVGDSLGCSVPSHDHAEVLKCLREKEGKDLIEASEALAKNLIRFEPVVDGTFLVHHPRVLAKQGAFDNTIPVMLGSSHHRGAILNFLASPLKPDADSYITTGDLKNLIKDVLGSKSDYETNAILFHYTNHTHPYEPEAIREESLDLITDSFIICPQNKFADELAYSGNDVYMFHIQYHPESNKLPVFAGNQNGEDVDFFLGHVHPTLGYTEMEEKRSHHMMAHVGHFMNSGDPNLSEDDRHFPKYSLRTKSYLDVRVGGTTGHFLRADNCAFFDHAHSRVKHAAALMAANNC